MTACQACSTPTISILSLGYMPPVNDFVPVGSDPKEQVWLPADLKYCPKCELVQLGYVAKPEVVFPPEYPYTSGTTKQLRDNFADLYRECMDMMKLKPNDLVVDIGSNDGTLLSNFMSHKVIGVEPTDVGDMASERGIYTIKSYFNDAVVASLKGRARLVTCANCFAHMPNIHDVVEGIKAIMEPGGVFVSESHYLVSLLERLQYDTIYHEHLRYYSLKSLRNLFAMHGMEVFRARPIPSHGGSIRVYAGMKGQHDIDPSIQLMSYDEPVGDAMMKELRVFAERVNRSRMNLMSTVFDLKRRGHTICGISAPSRSSTVISYCGLDATMIDCVYEIEGSKKIGKYMPGTNIPVLNESSLFNARPPDYAIMFSWHIADAIMPKLRERGYRGKFIMPCGEIEHAQAA